MEDEVPPSLYKYTAAARVDILGCRRIRLTPAVAQNDLFELRPVFDTLMSATQMVAEIQSEGDPIDAALRRQYKRLPKAIRRKLPYDVALRQARADPTLAGVLGQLRPITAAVLDEGRRVLAARLQTDIGILSLTSNLTTWPCGLITQRSIKDCCSSSTDNIAGSTGRARMPTSSIGCVKSVIST